MKKREKQQYFINIIIIILFVLLIISCSNAQLKNQMTQTGLYAYFLTSKGEIVVKLLEKEAPKTVSNFIGLANGTQDWTNPKSKKKIKKPFYKGLIFHRVISNFMIQGGCPLGNGTGGPGYSFEDEFFHEVKNTTLIDNETKAIGAWNAIFIPYYQQYHNTETRGADGPSKELNELIKKVLKNNSLDVLKGKTYLDYMKKASMDENQNGLMLNSLVDYGTLCMANSGPNSNGSQFFIVTKKEGASWLNGKHTVFGNVVAGIDIVHQIESVTTGASDKPIEDVVIKNVIIKRVK